MSKRNFVITIVFFLVSSILMGCSSEKYPIDTVAIIGDEVITEEQIKNEIVERNISIGILEKFKQQSNPASSIAPKDAILQMLNIKEEGLNKEQNRYIQARERAIMPLTENESFNNLLREKVLYQVANKQGYEVSQESALQSLEEGDEQTKEIALKYEKTLQSYNQALRDQDEVVRKYGFESWNAYQKHRSDKLAQAMTINLIKNNFIRLIEKKLPNGNDKIFAKDNAWEDYTEFLLKGKKSKVINDKYFVQFYGEPWSYGEIVLSSK